VGKRAVAIGSTHPTGALFTHSETRRPSKTMGGEKFDSYSVERKNLMVVVYTRQHSDIPIFVFLFKGNNVISIIRYLEYKKGLPIDPKLFRAPSNIHFSTP
jgi:hypothetical protein